ncbi:MAG: 50S ribosomal protein L18 [Proteobacteria bacterium]|nr:50S ribosomal protein L18 [Pseudomonadota bacterium]
MAIKSKKGKISSRERTKYRIRKRVTGTDDRPRISVFKSSKHTYVQAVLDGSGKTLVAVSTDEKAVQERASGMSAEGYPNDSKSTKGMLAAKAVGLVLAERLKAKSVSKVVFDRNGYVYHGRIRTVADGAREGGLQF